ncbi:MAG TPA: FtsX-like permease family protein [Thermoanaerobaculia bacterium]|nr:FtsX-like permease family protein [Thermoanaerobaculia bacterium]
MTSFRLIFRALVTGPARRRPIRALVPVLGVAIGVSAVAAIHHANRSVSESFRDSASAIAGKSDLAVVGARGVPLEDLERLRFLWRIGSFSPLVSGSAVMADGSGEIVAILGTDYGGDASVREMRLVAPSTAAGRVALASPGSILVPAPFAARHRLEIGSRAGLVAGGMRAEVTVAGLLELSGLARASGGDVLVTDVFTAGRLLGKIGFVDRVDVVLDQEVSRDAVRQELTRRLPPGLWIEAPGRAAEAAGRMARAFRFNLNALGSLTLAVGMFLVANAVSVSVLRRRPEIATLRALGASRASVFAAFIVEGIAVGAAGVILGELGGLALARAALSTVAGTVTSVYAPAAKISPAEFGPAVLAAAAVGMTSALLAAALPAAEATRVPPSPAMRPGSAEEVRRLHLSRRIAAAALAVGLAIVFSRVRPIAGFPWFGFAAVALVVLALALVSPALGRAGAAAARPPLERIFGASGRLASGFFGGSLSRNGITVTALAMALGMSLAMIATVASMRATVRTWVATTLRADLWVRPASGRGGGVVGDLPPAIVRFLESVPGVAGVDPFRAREGFDGDGRTISIAASDFRVLSRAGGAPLVDGRDSRAVADAARRNREVFVSEPYARRYGVRPGEEVSIRTPRGIRAFRVAGVYRDFSNDRGTVLLDRSLDLELFGDPRVTSAGVIARSGVPAEDLRRRILSGARDRFAIEVITSGELRDQVLRIFDRTFAVTGALEAIAVAVAVAGIANALTASAVERRRSFGLLRAVGASRAQVRWAVLLEALLAGLVATAAAFVASAAFAVLLLGVINPQSFGWTVVPQVPAGRLAAAAAIVLAASIIAGLVPAKIAASADPVSALAEE